VHARQELYLRPSTARARAESDPPASALALIHRVTYQLNAARFVRLCLYPNGG
jgi:hypothetical protein